MLDFPADYSSHLDLNLIEICFFSTGHHLDRYYIEFFNPHPSVYTICWFRVTFAVVYLLTIFKIINLKCLVPLRNGDFHCVAAAGGCKQLAVSSSSNGCAVLIAASNIQGMTMESRVPYSSFGLSHFFL